MKQSINIKALDAVSARMVRIFIYKGEGDLFLLNEAPVTYDLQSATTFAFSHRLNFEGEGLCMEDKWVLKAATENAETFNVIAEGMDMVYYTSSVRPESANYAANTGMNTISDANSNLDGTGDMEEILTADDNGTMIKSIVVKAQVSTTPGMIRLFLYDGSNTRLFREIFVPAVTKSATAHSFSHRIDFEGEGFALKDTWVLKAATENGEAFNVIAEGLDWTYPA